MIVDPDSHEHDSPSVSLPADRLEQRKHMLPFVAMPVFLVALFCVGLVVVLLAGFVLVFFIHGP